MYRMILVPLDGSRLGERAIPLALRIAHHTGASVEFAHVHERVVYGGGAPAAERRFDAEIKRSMREELETLRDRMAARAGLPVTASFLEGDIVPALQAHVEARGIDLVVMTTHGRGGLNRAWLGSVADALVRRLRVPVILARSRAVGRGGVDAPPFHRVLVPLDGSPLAEEVLERAVNLGSPNHTEYLLVRVVAPIATVPLPYPGGPGADAPLDRSELEWQERGARDNLTAVAERVRRPGVPVNERVVVHAQPARAILDVAREVDADLIALSTHGHGALKRALIGSVADKVIRGAAVPTLVYRPASVDTGDGEIDVPGAADATVLERVPVSGASREQARQPEHAGRTDDTLK